MTNQNPASQPQPPILNSELLAKLNAHADRSLDRLFTDIDELLSGDLEPESKSSQSNYQIESFRTDSDAHRQNDRIHSPQILGAAAETEDRSSPSLTATLDPAQPSKSKPKQQKQKQKQQSLPLWLKALLGLGVTSIALSSLLFWLVNERKVTIPKNIDTSWLPFQSQSRISPEDAKFAEYMQKSISKIESTPIPVATAPTTLNPAITNPSTPTQFTPNQAIATTPTPAKSTAIEQPIALVKTSQNGKGSTAIFKIDNKNQTIKIGQKIGSSNWSLINIFKKEITVKRKGGEIRSIKIGQKF